MLMVRGLRQGVFLRQKGCKNGGDNPNGEGISSENISGVVKTKGGARALGGPDTHGAHNHSGVSGG